MKVMLDTNILISAFIFNSKTMNKLIAKLSEQHEILIASYTIDEIYQLVKQKFRVNEKSIEMFFETFPFKIAYSPKHISNRLFQIRDDDDYIILHTAVIENVDIFITGDKDFEDVKIEKPKIMSVRAFLEKY